MKDASLAITVLSLMTACLPVGPPVPQRDTPTPVAPSPLIAATPARSSRQLPALDVPGTIVLFTSSTSFAIYRGGAVAEVRAPHEVRSARLAPDGAFLAAVLWAAGDQATYVWRYDLKSREQTTRKSNLPLAKHGVQWSPDARLFALVEERSLWIGDLEGRTQREAVPPYYWEKDLPPGKRLYATAWRLSDEVTVLAGDGGLPTSELALWRWRWGKSPEFDAVPLTLQSLPVVSWSPD